MSRSPIYKRILLKLSGEALMGDESFGIDPKVLDRIAQEVGELVGLGVEVGMVIGGGNLFRGKSLSKAGLGRISGDQMGMLATVMNAIAMRDALERAGFSTRIMSALPMSGFVDHYDRRKAIHHLQRKRVVIFAAGTGNPLVTTDSAASLRAIETESEILLKATNVDGVYSADPALNPMAMLYERITYADALEKELGVMDLSAFCQCRDHNMAIRVFNINKPNALLRVVTGESEGTLVEKGKAYD
ncbi:MAG: UMP kinase [Gammaproteobacteria bacterium 39-13]|nr:UMP kinase [Gammaproteobacteria bacterium]OJV85274.1 MAG: UMP kinase [Gammaproteobacteria bacterium 39-13]